MGVPPSSAFIPFVETDLESSIPARFEAQARKYAERIAFRSGDQNLSYRALNESANRLAHVLHNDHGANDSAPVALLLNPGVEPIFTLLAILKVGKIYVPLDPSYPTLKLARTVEDSCARVLITDRANLALAEALCSPEGWEKIIVIDMIDSRVSVENLKLDVPVNAMASIIYTSGSTGEPKGVVHTHRSILNEIRNYTNSLSISTQDRVSLTRPVTLSAALRSLFVALLNGATLCHFNLRMLGIAELGRWLEREKITIFRTAASTFRQLVGSFSGQNLFPYLRVIYFAAEPVYRSDVELYRKHLHRNCLLINGLGSTESFNYCYQIIDHDMKIETFEAPVGRPARGIEIFLINGDRPVPIGEIGEVVVKSQSLFLKYWQRPKLTSKAFIPDPNGNGKLYRSGDLAQYLPDGTLVHKGRTGSSVMVRGFTVQLGEVEAALHSFATVREAVVVAHHDSPGNTRLIAYVESTEQPAPTSRVYREYLATLLPRHMLPSTFVIVNNFPRKDNGKIDRRSLPPPADLKPVITPNHVPPYTSVQKKLANIWTNVLGLPVVGIHDEFLDLGGNSLLAMQIVNRAIEAFSVDIPISIFFESATIAAMSEEIERHISSVKVRTIEGDKITLVEKRHVD